MAFGNVVEIESGPPKCPRHHMPMVLRNGSGSGFLSDEYYGCPVEDCLCMRAINPEYRNFTNPNQRKE